MRQELLVGLLGFALCCGLANSTSVMAETRDEAQRRLEKRIAVLSAATSVTRTLENGAALSDALEKQLTAQILASPRDHREAARSKELARNQGIPNFVDAQINSAVTEAIKSQPSLTRAEIMAAVPMDARAKAADAITKNGFEEIYTKARRRAVEQQLASLQKTIKPPSFAEVNKSLTENPSWAAHENKLRGALLQSANGRQETTYEENSTAIDRLIEKSLADAKAEYEHQIRFVDTLSVTDIPQGAVLETEIHAAVSAKLKAELQRRQSPYSLFDVIAGRLASKSKELEAARCTAFIENTAAAFASDDELRARITAHVKSHRDPAASNRQLTAEFSDLAKKLFLEKYLREIGNPDTTVQRRIQELFSSDAARRAMERRVNREITAGTARVRAAITTEQLKQFAKLRSMKPTEKQIETRFDRAGALDYTAVVEILGGPHPEEHSLLVETISAVTQQVEKAFETPVSELRGQMRALKSLEKELESDLLLDVAANIPKEEINKKWVKRLVEHLQPAGGKLFDRTVRDVNKTVSQHYSALQRELADRQTKHSKASVVAMTPKSQDQSTATPSSANADASNNTNTKTSASATASGGTSGGASGSGMGSGGTGAAGAEAADGGNPEFVGDGEPPHGTITFSAHSTGNVVATADFCKQTVTFAPEEIENSARQLASAFSEPLIALRAKTKPEKPNDPLRVALVIGTDDVRQLMTIRFRSAVSRRIAGPVVWADAPGR